jgi:catechol 2,3-dioxygenase-like lactoylglutathione lyase family enzyme
MNKRLTRRTLLASLPAAAAASRVLGQAAAPIPAKKLNQMTLVVSDLQRSLDFYQGLFGMPVQARQGSTVLLRVGSGPQFLALKATEDGAKPGYSHFGISVNGFNAEQVLKNLIAHGVVQSDKPVPMTARIQMRGPEEGGAREGTRELFLRDPGGIVVQLQDTSYCGGAGWLGNVCRALQTAPPKGRFALRDLSHFTMLSPKAEQTQLFYQEVFGVFVQAHQGPAPIFGVGTGPQFLMVAGGGAGRNVSQAAASINHGCFFMDGFKPDDVLKGLTDYGLKPRGTPNGSAGPLQHYVTMRMPDRGGAPEGTAELYFTDPDGILLQLQDPKYCGGGGRLGEVCTA